MTNSRPVLEQYNELLGILGSHLRIEESLRMQDSDKPKGNNVASPSVVNMVEHNNSSRMMMLRALVHGRGYVDLRFSSGKIVSLFNVLHHARLSHVHFKSMQEKSKDGLIPTFDMDTEKCKTCMLNKITKKPFQNVKRETKVLELIHSDLCDLHATPSLGNKKYFVTFVDDASRVVIRLPDPKLKTLGERGIECIFAGYDEHSKAFRFYVIEPNDSVSFNSIIESMDAIFDENRLSSVSRPSQRFLVNRTKDIGGSVVPEEVTEEVVQQPEPELRKSKSNRTLKDFGPEFQLYLIERTRDEDFAFWKEAINDEIDSIMGNNTLVLADLPPICKPFGCKWIFKRKLKVDLTKEFLSLRFSMKDMGEADVILGIRIKHESNGIAISQSYYIENVLKKFNYFDCTPVSTPMDTSEKLKPNNDILVTLCWKASKKQTCITGSTMEFEFVALAYAGKEDEWLKNLLLEIPLCSKPIAPNYICCDSAATLAKAYSQMYNRKSRHLGVRHNMIRELIMNGVTSIEFMRSQQNLANHLTKGLARDLVIKFAERMGLKSN
ncbi:zinc finger, CCHC-type containing protein [Tanacetum coccineum]